MPGLFFLLPTFLLYAQFGRSTGIQLIGTYPALILIDLTFAVPFAVWLLGGWFANQQVEPEEAAAVFGAGAAHGLSAHCRAQCRPGHRRGARLRLPGCPGAKCSSQPYSPISTPRPSQSACPR